MALTSLLSEIKTRIEATLTSNSITGYTVKRGELAHKPDKQIALYSYPGNGPSLGFGRPGLQYLNPGLQVSVRGTSTDYEGPHAVLNTIWEDLTTVQDELLTGTRYLLIKANQQPFLDSRDGDQRCLWKVNFICEIEI